MLKGSHGAVSLLVSVLLFLFSCLYTQSLLQQYVHNVGRDQHAFAVLFFFTSPLMLKENKRRVKEYWNQKVMLSSANLKT